MRALALAFALVAAGCSPPAKPALVVPYAATPGAPPPVGAVALDFTLPAATGVPVRLADLLARHRAVAVVFYRGFW